MKTNVLKTVLPAFALMLALVASIAFTSAEKSMEEDAPVQAYFSDGVAAPQLENCNLIITTNPVCTNTLFGPRFGEQVYKLDGSGQPTIILYKD